MTNESLFDVAANRQSRKWTRREQVGRVLRDLAGPVFRLSPRPLWGWRRALLRGRPWRGFVLNPFDRVLDLAVGWLAAPGALQVRFEDLIGPEGGGSAVAQRNQIERLHAFVRPPKPLAEVEAGRIYGGTLTFNKGRAARWRELGNPRLIDQINDRIGPRLKDWGYGE